MKDWVAQVQELNGTSRIFLPITETQHSLSTQMTFWIYWNSGLRRASVGNLLFKDLIPWTKACA
eukprot:8977401-Ditylum_brightwellii.AAC.1